MNRSRITSAVATAALVGGLAAAQFATAGSAFAAGGADLNAGGAFGVTFNRSTGEVMDADKNYGFTVNVANTGPDATRATLTVTGVKNIHFDTRKDGHKPTFAKDQGEDGKPVDHNLTVKSIKDKQVQISFDLAADGDEAEKVYIPGFISGKKQTLRTSIKGATTDPNTTNNDKTVEYTANGPDWDPKPKPPTNKPKPPKPTEKPTSKPTEKPTSKPTEKPTSKPSDDSNTPAPAGGSDKGGSGGGGDLAETGGNSNTPMLIGGAGALVVVGGAAVFMAQRRKAAKN
ncbi:MULTISPECIES: LAETG motif-containing sortase-dependent surface protein [unclassified Streptomyces]|uniref:LAETG motif-containing sortase-dependent surface protein n=1 Tax=unclassified Streptomyces TaxID=2593676 RepID=UPI002DDC379F|nr:MULTISPECIES: LAETG motif-containing sortase-dependent surface protein [unclassified Streptomyces]WSB78254.1 LPXTG cell wall anchor domain-containing protein [Streptomyces sp. NBC_01775]WSS13491.1 LPXTG cell wall anchor domain-containing protein [Streptomyces sp. NBC_01186]WSS42289.1 LPXTG cell wall anchor domain-containing protein [Streptomyces sp. NBC_01187]